MSIGGKRTRGIVAALIALSLGISLMAAGCGQATSNKGAAANNGAPAANKLSAADQLAAQRGYILIGEATPLTGQIAAFTTNLKWVQDRALAAINKDGGVYVKALGKKLPVKLVVRDTQSSPSTAAQVASELVMKDKVDMMIALWHPDVVNPVTGVAERYKMPTVGWGNPMESWVPGGPYHWSYDCAIAVSNVMDMNVENWKSVADKTDKVVGLLFANDADGVSWAKVCNEKLPQEGFKVVDPGRFPENTNDFTSLIDQFKKDHVDIVKGTMPPPVFAPIWRQMHEHGYVPKVANVSLAALFPTDVAALGDNLGVGLTTEVFWNPWLPYKSSLDGETAMQLADAYTKANVQDWSQMLGQDYASIELAADVFKRATDLDPAAVQQALDQTDLDTIQGHIKFNQQHVCIWNVTCGQWVRGTKFPWVMNIVGAHGIQGLPTKPMLFPLPKE